MSSDFRNSFLGAIRTKTSLSTAIRETAICRVAVLNKAWYEWESHSPILRSAPGKLRLSLFNDRVHIIDTTVEVTDDYVTVVLKSPPRRVSDSTLSEALTAVLAYTDAMTLDVTVPDEVFAQLRKQFSDKEVVEITSTIAAYNCVSRFLVALDVGERNAQQGPMEGGKE